MNDWSWSLHGYNSNYSFLPELPNCSLQINSKRYCLQTDMDWSGIDFRLTTFNLIHVIEI